MFKNEAFLNDVSICLANYMHANNIQELIHNCDPSIIEQASALIGSKMYEDGYAIHPKPQITDENIQYICSLGYSEEAMAEKRAVLSRWQQDKDFNMSQRIAMQAIIDEKTLWTCTDMDWDKMRVRTNEDSPSLWLWEKAYVPSVMLDRGGHFHGKMVNAATNEVKSGIVKIPECEQCPGLLDCDDVGLKGNDMFVVRDVFEDYLALGGYNVEMHRVFDQRAIADAKDIEAPALEEIQR